MRLDPSCSKFTLRNKLRKRILLFGGGGFLGTNLLTGLCANCDVVCLDRGRRYGSFGNLSRSVRLVKGVIEELAVLCREMRFDHLFYLAGGNAARLTGEQRDTETESARRSLEATLEILATTGKGTVLTYFSSYLCYASSAQRLTEQSPTCDTAYARLHLTNERSICESGVPNMIIRLSTVYGRYGITNALQTGGVVGKFVSAMSEGKPIRLNNAGRDGMDFLHTSDFVRACAQIVDRPQTTGVFNLGSERRTSVLRLAQ